MVKDNLKIVEENIRQACLRARRDLCQQNKAGGDDRRGV